MLKKVIVKAQQGDLEAFGMLVRRFQNMAYGYAFAILKDHHLAEDAIQEAFLDAHKRLASLRAPEAFGSWLRTIVFKHCDRLTRRKSAELVPIENASELIASDLRPDEVIEKSDLYNRVIEMIQCLPQNERVVTSLFYMNEYSLKEISDFLDLPISKIKNRLHTARKRLKEGMMQMVDEGFKNIQLPERFADVVVQMQFVIGKVNPLRSRMKALSDLQLREKHLELQRRLVNREARSDVLAEGFALIREVCQRVLHMELYDIQLVASMMLDRGWVAEVVAGEGKSLVCLPAAYLAVLEGRHVHVATMNDSTTIRDATVATDVFSFLGVTVGAISSQKQDDHQKRAAYACDIVYGSYTTFGFDYLWDRIRTPDESRLQTALDLAIISEADRVLIDACRTPLMIAQKASTAPIFYQAADQIAKALIEKQGVNREDVLYKIDPRHPSSIVLTRTGKSEVSTLIRAEQTKDHQIEHALRAHLIFEKDRDYVVQNGRVLIVDAQVGKTQPNRRWSEGLHQAVEAKEHVDLTPQETTEIHILVQDYFRQYKKICGLTGTAPATELQTRYGLEVGRVPTRNETRRIDFDDRVFANTEQLDAAVVEEVRTYSQEMGRPVVVGVEHLSDSERLSKLFNTHRIPHRVLNARSEMQETQILSRAGWKKAVTIATGMVGRGIEIRLSESARRAGGLHIVGYGRRALRHLDDQLKHRAGIKGEPGSSRFFLSIEDDLLQTTLQKITVAQKQEVLQKNGIEAQWISEAIAHTQEHEAKKRLDIHKALDKL